MFNPGHSKHRPALKLLISISERSQRYWTNQITNIDISILDMPWFKTGRPWKGPNCKRYWMFFFRARLITRQQHGASSCQSAITLICWGSSATNLVNVYSWRTGKPPSIGKSTNDTWAMASIANCDKLSEGTILGGDEET